MRQDVHTLAGAYALHALPVDELQRFERHLASCDDCVEEVRGLTETTALLGEAAAQRPPDQLRRQVMDAVSRTRQLAPAPLRPAPPRLRWWQGGRGLMLAACLVVILAVGGVAVFQQTRVAEMREANQQIATVLSAPDAQTEISSLDPDTTMTVVSSQEREALVFVADGLEPLNADDYQLWFADPDGSVRSAGLLTVDEDETAVPLYAGDLADAEGVAVTVEPAGGSEQPTTDPIASMPLDGEDG